MDSKPKTIFCDIDGVLFKHWNEGLDIQISRPSLIIRTLSKLNEWDAKGYNIILTTGRRESSRKVTEVILKRHGIFYDKLIMGIGGGDRILINDRKPDSKIDTAYAINLDRKSVV